MNKNAVFLIGVIGGLVGYACGVLATPGTAVAQQQGSNNGGEQTPAQDAGAAPANPIPPPACLQWQVKALPDLVVHHNGEITIPEGWEPFAAGSGQVVVRRCIH